jgi:hypothetical protein
VFVHWLREERRSRPCLGPRCPHCAGQLPRRWKGYAPAFIERKDPATGKKKRVPVVLELTETAAWDLKNLDGWKTVRGLAIKVSRKGKHSNAPLRLEGADQQLPEANLPPAFDVRPVLERLWSLCGQTVAAAEPPDDDNAETLPFRRGSA